jgi:hypothetical protein
MTNVSVDYCIADTPGKVPKDAENPIRAVKTFEEEVTAGTKKPG